METYSEVLMEDLIDCNVEETIGLPHSSWTEQALDLFISILKNVKKDNYSSQRDMLNVITIKMSERNYRFNVDQIEGKYNSLRKMYMEKKERNQTIEPELAKLFGDYKTKSYLRQKEQYPQKKPKLDTGDDSLHSTDSTPEDGEDKKILWSPEATRIFLDLLEELRPQLGSKLRTKKQMWEEICRRLKTHGYNFTYPQVENKWKALLRHYRGRLELMRHGKTHHRSDRSVFASMKQNYSAWPELFESTSRNIPDSESDISFANDQKLPYEDDGYADEEPYQFEEVCQLPDAEAVSDEVDPVMIEEVKPLAQHEVSKKSSLSNESQKSLEDNLPQLEKIAKEIANLREENRKHQNELLQIKRMQLKAYEQRTTQFTRIADGFSDLMSYLKRKASDENI